MLPLFTHQKAHLHVRRSLCPQNLQVTFFIDESFLAMEAMVSGLLLKVVSLMRVATEA